MSGVRTRFAPSPTGALHVGGVRTALFSWLFARHHGGAFVLRIEDTDRERSRPEWEAGIIEALRWLGLDWNEGPFRQSEREPFYATQVERLRQAGAVYPCTCSAEELAARRGDGFGYDRRCRPGHGPGPNPDRAAALRLKIPLGRTVVIDDLVKGPVAVSTDDIDDFVIVRSDGTPTYQMVVTADDIDMSITHVIRGDDHLKNTAKQILIYEALAATPPAFAHLPQVLGADRGRLSKRHGATDVLSYRDAGYLPDALVNFMARLGWAHGDDEFLTRSQLVELFDLAGVGRSAGVFDREKLDWLNGEHLRRLADPEIATLLRDFLARRGETLEGDPAWQARLAGVLRDRARTLEELAEQSIALRTASIHIDPKAAQRCLSPEIVAPLRQLQSALQRCGEWRAAELETTVRATADALGLKLGALAQPLRVALTGSTASPGIFDVLELVGRERSAARIDHALAVAAGGPP